MNANFCEVAGAFNETGPAQAAIRLSTRLYARILRHDPHLGFTTLTFEDGELRVPHINAPQGTVVEAEVDASDVSISLFRPMDISITNRVPGTIAEVEYLEAPYARVTFSLGASYLHALVTWESVERLALRPGVRAWAMLKTVVISELKLELDNLPGASALSIPRTATGDFRS